MSRNISKQLISLTKEAFFDYVLPKIEGEYPESVNKFFVNITSSVAYGVADKHSDIDVFVLFKSHEDYLHFHEKFDELIKSIKFPEKFEGMCDKGMRFEFESLKKSDVLELYTSQSYGNWMNQTEWLLCWLINSVTIYDPSDYITSFKKKMRFFPKKVLKSKVNLSFVSLIKYQKQLAQANLLKQPYLSDFYFFKACKCLMDLLYWSDKKYVPHPKWQCFILQFIGKLGKDLYADLNSALHKENSEKLKLINKWTDLLSTFWYNSKVLYRALYIYYTKDYNVNKIKNFKHSEPVFFENYSAPFINKSKLTSLIDSTSIPDNFFLSGETNILLRDNYDYDSIMRFQDKYAEIDVNKISPETENKRINYLHFIIWRKIRVIQGALKRDNQFNQYWYSNQVVEHLIEMIFRLKKKKLPYESIQFSSLKSSNFFPEIYELLIKSYDADIPKRVELFWKCFFILQDYIKKNEILSKFQIENPLIVQFDIEYWKYENLRL